MNQKHIYMDYAASTPVDSAVVEAMLPYWSEVYGNSSSVHYYGIQASRALEKARLIIAELLNGESGEFVFTGCGSESDNLAIRGAMWAARVAQRGNHLITCSIEHKAVLETARQLRDLFGFDLTILPVDETGQIDLDQLETSIRPDTELISIMAANNEIGTLQQIHTIGEIARQHNILFHTDAVQSAAITSWDLRTMPIDLLSIAPHKFYGPKGIGILYIRQGIELVSALTGGGQEDGRRPGTANVPSAVGAAEALQLAVTRREANVSHYQTLRDRLINGIMLVFPQDCMLTGHPLERLPNNASFAFRAISGNDLLMHLDMAGVSASSGSACLTGDPKPSAVLEAVGLGPEWTRGGLRLTVGRQNNIEDVDYVIEILPGIIDKLRQIEQRIA
jgi:cysteine desulfurase